MKTKLDQISIPTLRRGLSEMAHTLVGKAVPLQLKGHGFKRQWGQPATSKATYDSIVWPGGTPLAIVAGD